MDTLLSDLQAWYAAQCDGDWEHAFGVKIETLDNPGWSLKVDLDDTLLEDKAFAAVKQEATDGAWLECSVEGKKFIGYAGPHQLAELISTFLAWAKTEPDWLAVEVETEPEALARKDKEFWKSLGEETGPEECRRPGCTSLRIGLSVFCRVHHFETIRGHQPPDH